MLRKIKLQNSTILFIGLLIVLFGIALASFEYFKEKKEKAFIAMNVKLYQNETPEQINDGNVIESPSTPDDPDDLVDYVDPTIQTKYDYVGILEIPKINLKTGFLDLGSKYNDVNYNVTVINGSVFPDQELSNLIFAAHSGNCSYCYFNKLYKLSKGDMAYVYYKDVKYSYKVVDIYEVEKTGTVAIYKDYTKSTLVLITCTRNSDTKQTVYILNMQ